MKNKIITGIAVIAFVAMCAAVWTRSAEVGDLPAELVNTAVIAETEARSEEMSQILLSGDSPAPEVEIVAESEPPKTEITAEEKTELAPPTETTFRTVSKSASISTEPKPGTIAVIDGNRCMWAPGFMTGIRYDSLDGLNGQALQWCNKAVYSHLKSIILHLDRKPSYGSINIIFLRSGKR